MQSLSSQNEDKNNNQRPKECVRKVVNDLVFHISSLSIPFSLHLIHENLQKKHLPPHPRPIDTVNGYGSRMMSIIDKEIKTYNCIQFHVVFGKLGKKGKKEKRRRRRNETKISRKQGIRSLFGLFSDLPPILLPKFCLPMLSPRKHVNWSHLSVYYCTKDSRGSFSCFLWTFFSHDSAIFPFWNEDVRR